MTFEITQIDSKAQPKTHLDSIKIVKMLTCLKWAKPMGKIHYGKKLIKKLIHQTNL